jgi:hypothetical protein
LISALGDQPFSVDARNFEQARAAQKVLICEACFKDRNSTIELAPEVKQSQNGNSGFTFPQLEPIFAPSLRSIFVLLIGSSPPCPRFAPKSRQVRTEEPESATVSS